MGGQSLEGYVASRVESAVADCPPEVDVYAYSLWLFYDDDEPLRPVLWFGSNTESHVRSVLERASSADEARWNFAFWRQNTLAVIGGDDDWHGAEMLSTWIEHDGGFGLADPGVAVDPARAVDLESQIEFALFRKIADAVALIHERGRVLGPGGRRVPIVVHELEYFDETATQNAKANPGGLLPEAFFALCRGEG